MTDQSPSPTLAHLHQGYLEKFDLARVSTPAFVVFEDLLKYNLDILRQVKHESGCHILLALKGFSMPRSFGLLAEVLDGTCASGSHEARLGHEKFSGGVHVYSPGFSRDDIEECAPISKHMVFNSWGQWELHGPRALELNPALEFGLRVNPEHSEGGNAKYDPCTPGSRLGITRENLPDELPPEISGLHFHTLCEMGSDALERTLKVFENQFAEYLPSLKWVNFGGGHHVTHPDYDVDRLVSLIRGFRQRHSHLEVYLEPGEAIALNAGVLVSGVLDVTTNGNTHNAILDASATCHMPDVLEVPYRPEILHSNKPGERPYTYQLGGASCLAGDVMGSYSFDEPLEVGSRVCFLDMAIYSMVKTNTFNGIKLPSIYYATSRSQLEKVREFGYEDFAGRIG